MEAGKEKGLTFPHRNTQKVQILLVCGGVDLKE